MNERSLWVHISQLSHRTALSGPIALDVLMSFNSFSIPGYSNVVLVFLALA